MALVNGFDPSKEYEVVKGFYEAGRKYVKGDRYAPRTKIGKSKVLFRHFIGGRIKIVEDAPSKTTKQKEPLNTQEPETASNSQEGIESNTAEKKTSTSTTPKKSSSSGRGRPAKKKQEE